MKDSPICSICNSGAVDDYLHVFFQCEKVVEVGNWLLTAVRSRGCDIAPTDVLSLSLNLSKDNMFCIPWLVINVLENIWQARIKKKRTSLSLVRADLESKIMALRKSRLSEEAVKIENLLNM